MQKKIVVADSGSTKTDWLFLVDGQKVNELHGQGLNPCLMKREEMIDILQREVGQYDDFRHADALFFYGSGCRGEQLKVMEEVLAATLGPTKLEVQSDLLGAARSVCGLKDGVACILGTGSNSCLFIQGEIKANIPSLGYILGDEGGGAALGRRLISDIWKKQLPLDVQELFFNTYPLTTDELVRQVYKEAFPNRFLAGFVPFLSTHRAHPALAKLLREEFSRFVCRNVLPYEAKGVQIHFVGSVACLFREELRSVLTSHGLSIGKVIAKPIEGLAEFHTRTTLP